MSRSPSGVQLAYESTESQTHNGPYRNASLSTDPRKERKGKKLLSPSIQTNISTIETDGVNEMFRSEGSIKQEGRCPRICMHLPSVGLL
jgi:hypothetical protein